MVPPIEHAESDPIQQAKDTLYRHGMTIRRQVVGDRYVDGAVQATNTGRISAPAQEYVNAAAWGMVWGRNGLDRDADAGASPLSRRDRSLLNLAMLCCLNRSTELATHIRGALTNGVTEEEIAEVMLQVCVYAGAPAGLEGCRVAEQAIAKYREEEAKE